MTLTSQNVNKRMKVDVTKLVMTLIFAQSVTSFETPSNKKSLKFLARALEFLIVYNI